MRKVLLLASVFLLPGCFGGSDEVPTMEQPSVGLDVANLSPIVHDTILRERSVAASSVDGAGLVVDVWRPDTNEPVPIILVQSPYWSFVGDAKSSDRPTWYIDYFVPRGYAVALGEMRGTRESGGCWDFGGPLDQQDGHDMVEHLAAMPWSSGNVGMLGQSHVGMSQVAAAVTAPPSLKAIVPIAAVTDWYRYLHYEGAPYVLNRGTPPAYFAVHASPSDPPGPAGDGDDPVGWLLTQAGVVCGDNVVHVSQSAELDGDKDAYWQERDLIAKAGNTEAAVFLVHGFLDENVKTDHFLDYWEALPEDVPKKAWYGQWFHQHPMYLEWRNDIHAWYDHFLKGIDNGILDEPAVTVQDNLRLNRTEPDWPAGMVWERWGPEQDNTLHRGPPWQDRDPLADPGVWAFPGDDRGSFGSQTPYAVVQPFRSEPLDSPVHIAGEARLNVTMELTGTEARLIAALFDVAPDGTLDEITRGYLDARHRDGPSTNQDVPPIVPIDYVLHFFPRDHVVQAGHRLELAVFGGDLGCQVNPLAVEYASTCEGTGILPVAQPGLLRLYIGGGSDTVLWLPIVRDPGPERPLTQLDDWLDLLPP